MWTLLARHILRNRVILIIAIALITAFMAYKASFVRLEYSFPAMLPESDSTFIQNEQFREQFGQNAAIILMGFQDEDFFQYKKFNDWVKLVKSVKEIDGINEVVSVSNTFNLVKNIEEKKFELDSFFPEQVESQDEMDSLASIFYSLPFYKDLIYHGSNLFLAGAVLEKDVADKRQRVDVVEETEQLFKNFGDKYKLEMYFSGSPYTRTKIGKIIKEELGLFIILASIVTAVLLFMFFRSLKVVFFSLLVVGTSVVWALGTLHLLGFNLTVLSGMIPPLLIVIGIPNNVFLLNKYHLEYRNHGNKIKSLQRVISKVGNAIFLTNLTTAAGFATFIITNNRLLVEFGIVASLNIIGIFIISLLLVPTIFSFLSPPKKKHIKHLENPFVNGIIKKFCYLTENYRILLYVSAVILVVISLIGISKMKATGFLVDDISKKDKVYTDLKFFEKQIGGVVPVEISIDTKKRNGILNIGFFNKIEELQNKLTKFPELSRSISLANGVKFARQAYYNGNENMYKLPSRAESNFILSYLNKERGNTDLLKSFVDSTAGITRMSMFVADIGSQRMNALQDSVKKVVRSVFPEDKYNTIVTGPCFLYTKGTSFLIKNLFMSLFLAIILISVFMAIVFSSFRMVLISLIPNILPLIFTAGIMGYFGIAIKPSTLLVFSIAFGISVDNAIHFLAKYGQELQSTKKDIGKSVNTAMKEAGVSIIYTGIILFFGFGIFFASKFGGTKALGILIAITILLAVFANLLLLPSLLFSRKKIKAVINQKNID